MANSFFVSFWNGLRLSTEDMSEFEQHCLVSSVPVKMALGGTSEKDLMDSVITALVLLEAKLQGHTAGSGEFIR